MGKLWSKLFPPRKTPSQTVTTAKPMPTPTPLPLGELVARIAEGEVGVRESPPNSNTGPRVCEYQQATWLDGTGWAWCAALVCWCVREALKISPTTRFNRPQTAGAWDCERWAREQELDLLANPAPGDIERGDILVYRFSHIGIATGEAAGDSVPVVEGNTDDSGGREGGGVYARRRKVSQIRSRIRLTQ